MTARQLALGVLVACLLVFVPRRALAHELRPAAVSIDERESGRFIVRTTPSVGVGASFVPELSFPASCTLAGALLDCGEEGLNGEIRVRNLASARNQVIARVTWLDGRDMTALLTFDAPGMSVRSAAGGRQVAKVALDYCLLGIEHILGGVDHLLFVLGLVLLVRFGRGLVVTITAFTLAHSITLGAAVMGVISVPQAPIEAAIALSILLVAVECARPRDSLSRRLPWVVAFSFGLLHGFGFAGALHEVGLSLEHTALSLVFFNAGVELGQLAVIALAWSVARVLRRHHQRLHLLESACVYAMGTLAAYWSIERVSAVFLAT